MSDHARRKKKRKQAANMHAGGHVWCHTMHAGVATCTEREKERNIGAYTWMHIGSNQRITPAPNGGSAVGLNKQTENPKETRGSLQAMNNFFAAQATASLCGARAHPAHP